MLKKGAIFILAMFLIPLFAGATNIDSANNYAWGENVGWIDFGLDIGNVEVLSDKVTGYAYGSNIGWISLNCLNTNTCNSINYGVINDGNGNLSGYAWGENIGWIDFSGISINESGEFTGYAYSSNAGYVSFNCANTNTCSDINFKLTTTWRKTVTPPVVVEPTPTRRSGGGGGGGSKKKVIQPTASSTLSVSETVIAGPTSTPPTTSILDENRISTISTDLFLGMQNKDVKKLQQLLNKLGYTVSQTGAGSLGNETEYFGSLTQKALAKFQADNQIYPSVGYFGPKTKALFALKGF